MMADVLDEKFNVDGFKQSLELRNNNNKDKMADMYMSKAKGILMNPPFSYSESISQEVSEGIVNYGDKLMANAIAEEDSDGELDELNGIGDDFQNMEISFALLLKTEDHQNGSEIVVRDMYPMPTEEINIDIENTFTLRKAFAEMKSFINKKSRRAFSAVIAFLGNFTEDGVAFDDGRVVPAHMIIQEVKNLIQKKDPEDILPNCYDVVFVQGKQIKVFSINVFNGNTVGDVQERFVNLFIK